MGRFAPILLAALLAAPAGAITYQFSTPIAGDTVPVTTRLVGVAGGVEITVSIPPGAGDLLGLFGNVVTASLVPGMGVSNPNGIVTAWQLAANAVQKVGAGNNTLPVAGWDWGVKLGHTGAGTGVIETASFTLTGVTVAELTGAANQGFVLGVRIQTTTGAEGSAKIGLPEGTPPVAEPPTIEITSPADGALLGASAVSVSGAVSGVGVTVTVNGQPAIVSGGTFSATLSLADGTHAITATATNAAGTASDAISISIDTMGPQITITAPAPGSLTNQTPVTVSGLVADASSVGSVEINGASFPVSGGSFTGTASLAEGANTILVTAADSLGHPGDASVSVTLDATPPAVAFSTPPDGTLTTLALIAAEGTVTDASPITSFEINGQSVPLTAGAFDADVSLALGTNPITAVAIDAAGNSGQASVLVTRGNLPTIAITSPANGALTNQGTALISGTATDAASVTVAGVAAALSGSSWSATVPLSEGANPLVATASNAFGSAQAQVSVRRDSTPPVVTITLPANGASFSNPALEVSGSVADASAIVSLSLNGSALSPGSAFATPYVLMEGANTLSVEAVDAAGNAGTATVTVTLVTVAPLAVTIDSPPAGSLISADRVTVVGTVGDPAAAVLVNGVVASVTGAQYVATNVPVTEGENVLTASATASGGRAGQASVSVTFNLPPKVTITSPRDGAALDVASVDVMGFVDDPAALVRVNGMLASVTSDGGFFVPAVALAPDANEITATAVDLLGAAGTDQIEVSYDQDGSEAALRMVLVDPGRCTFPPEQSCDPVVLIARDLDEFRAEMAALGQPLSGFSSPVSTMAVGDRDFPVYAFAEIGGSMSLSVATISSLVPAESPKPLLPLGGLGADLASIGLDPFLGTALVPIDIDAAYFARFDLDSVAPFVRQDESILLETDEKLRNLTAQPIGVANAWTVQWRFTFPFGGTSTTPTFLELSEPTGTRNRIRLTWTGGLGPRFRAEIYDANGVTRKQWEWINIFPGGGPNFFFNAVLRWDGTNLTLFHAGGGPDPADAKVVDGVVTQTDTARRLIIENGNIYYHSLAIWNRALGNSEMGALASSTSPIFDLSTNTAPYLGAADLQHWWRFGFDAADIGKDFGGAAVPIDADVNAVGVDATDIAPNRPAGFANPPLAGFTSLQAFLGPVTRSLSLLVDHSPPSVEIASPAAGSVVAGSVVTVTGQVTDGFAVGGGSGFGPVFSEVTYRATDAFGTEVSGGQAPLHEGTFTIEGLVLGAGPHCIDVRAVDLGGNLGGDIVCLVTDPSAPGVTLVSPLDGTSVLEASIGVTLNFGAPAVLVSVNGVPDGRSFPAGLAVDAVTLPLALGANSTRLVFDAGDGPFELGFTIFRIDSFRGVEIVSPTNGASVGGSSVVVSGRVPRGTPVVQVNGIEGTIAADRVSFSASVPLHAGENEIRAVELAFGRSDVVTVTRDDEAPHFLAIFPPSGTVTPDASVQITGSVSEPAQVMASNGTATVSVATVPVTLSGSTLFGETTLHEFELPALGLAAGANAIELSAVDRAGLGAGQSLSVIQAAGVLALVAPAPGSTVPDLRTDLSLAASGDLVLEALYSGALRLPAFEGFAVGAGPLTLAGVPLMPGFNDIRIVYSRPGGGLEVLSFGLSSSATAAATIGGTITDAASGQPIANALVSLTIAGQTVVATTGADGRYSTSIDPGAVAGMATAGGYAPATFTVTVSNGETVTANLALNATGLPAFPNELAILVPPDGTVTDFEQVTVVGTVFNPASMVSVNGIAAEVIGNRFTARHVPLAMGANAVSATATLVGLPTVSRSVAVERADVPVLDVEIFSPPDAAHAPGSGLVVRGFVSAKDALTVISGGFAPVEEGVFQVPDVVVPAGSTTVGAAAVMPDGVTTARDDVGIQVASSDPALLLEADPAVGEVPLETRLELFFGAAPFGIGRLDFDLDGDLLPDVVGSLEPFVEFVQTQAVPVTARALVTTSEGVELSAPARLAPYLAPFVVREFAHGNPVDLAPAPDREVYVLDGSAGQVSRYAQDGTLVTTFGSGGAGTEQLSNPQALAVAADGRVYVADTGNDRIQVFSAAGSFERSIGSSGSGPGQLARPLGVSVQGDQLIVSDAGNGRVQLLTIEGEFLSELPLSNPRGSDSSLRDGWLVASPSLGLVSLAVSAGSFGQRSAFQGTAIPPAALPAAPTDVSFGEEDTLIVDAAGARVVVANPRLGLRRVIEGFNVPPRAALQSGRREAFSIYVADGQKVVEVELPIDSPLPVLTQLKSRLLASDTNGALQLIAPLRRSFFQQLYSSIEPDLAIDAEAMQEFHIVELRDERAVGEILMNDTQDGGPFVTRRYPVRFVRSEDGTWQIFDY